VQKVNVTGVEEYPACKGAATLYILKLWVSIFPSCPYRCSTTAVKDVEGRHGKGSPAPADYTGSGGDANDFGAFHVQLYAISRILVHLTAAWKWEIPRPICWIVGVMFPYNFSGMSDTPDLNFGVSGHTRHPQRLHHWPK